MYRKLVICAVLLLAIGGAAAADDEPKLLEPGDAISMEPTGRHPSAVASASSLDDTGWMVLDSIDSDKANKIQGTIRLSLLDATSQDTPESRDRARVIAKIKIPPDDTEYTVRFVKVDAEGEVYAHFGGVATRRAVFGDTGISFKSLPKTMAIAAAWGEAEIFKGDESLANDLDAMIFVVPGMRDPNTGKMLAANNVDFNRFEVHLILPGSLEGGKAVPDMPGGFLYLVWPNAALDLRNVGGRVSAPTSAPTALATGMYGGVKPSEKVEMVEEEPVEETATAVEEEVAPEKPEEPEVKVKGMVEEIGMQPLTISLMEDKVLTSLLGLSSGDIEITLHNRASKPRGLVITGNDIAGHKFVRYTPVLRPGENIRMRLYAGSGPLYLTSYRQMRQIQGRLKWKPISRTTVEVI